ncbi:MAG: response regulator [Nostocaceae cyanobacterium]|nr:response regulator [Nostocaceae cyanobacterium]
MTSRRILLIENETDLREVVQLCLETVAGWQVLTATSTREVIVTAETKHIDLIIIDEDAICTPPKSVAIYPKGSSEAITSENDLSAILHTLQHHPVTEQIPVILLTTVPIDNWSQFTSGVKAIISKPFDLITLVGKIATAMNWVEIPET